MPLSDWSWNVLRSYTYWLLQDANGTLVDAAGSPAHLTLGVAPPKTVQDIFNLIRGWAFALSLTQELSLVAAALADASGSFAAAHDLAASIMVNAPSQSDVFRVAQDLSNISAYVQRDAAASALSGFFAGAAAAARAANV